MLCVGLENGLYREYPEKRCQTSPKPEEQAACFRRPCSTWFTTSWSQVGLGVVGKGQGRPHSSGGVGPVLRLSDSLLCQAWMGPQVLFFCRTGSRMRDWHTQAGENLEGWALLPQEEHAPPSRHAGYGCVSSAARSPCFVFVFPSFPLVTGEHLGYGKSGELCPVYSSHFLCFLSQHQCSKHK